MNAIHNALHENIICHLVLIMEHSTDHGCTCRTCIKDMFECISLLVWLSDVVIPQQHHE